MGNVITIKVDATLNEGITYKNNDALSDIYAFADSVGIGSGNEWLVPSWWNRHLYQ